MEAIDINNVKKVNLDSVLDEFGLFQRYHIERILLTCLALLFNAMFSMNYVFAAEEVSYRCKDDLEGDYCRPFNSTHTCTEWLYDNPDSFFAYFDLACQDWKRTLVGTAHNVGYMCGLVLIGTLSDGFGRKPIAVATGIVGAVLGILRSFSPWYWFYIAMEFLEGAIGDNVSPLFVLILELTPKKKKLFPFMCCGVSVVIGGVILAGIAWLIADWRWFLRAIYIPAFSFISYKYFLDESPRWLLTKGRKNQAAAILKRAAKKNKFDIDKNSLENLSCETDKSVPLTELLKETFKSKKLRNRFFVCLIWWTTSTFVNYGLLINSVTLEGNKYINYMLVALVDLPGSFIITYLLIYFKRKIPLMLSFFAGAVLCISQPFLPTNLPWLSVFIYMAGKMMCWFYFYITYVYTVELFPTYTRNSMHALCSSIGRVGSIAAPQTPLLMVYWSGLPSFVFGLAAFVAGLSTFLVPDISDDALPDTVHQAEALGKSKLPAKTAGTYNEGFDMEM